MSAYPIYSPGVPIPDMPRQLRHRHLCAVLGVRERSDDPDGYTPEDWQLFMAGDRDRDARREVAGW